MRGLIDRAAHEPLDDRAWDEAVARATIERIAADAEDAFHDGTWPVHPADREDKEHGSLRLLYCGDSGVVLALDLLREAGLVELRRDYADVMAGMNAAYVADPDEPTKPPQAGLLAGETGILLVADRLAPTSDGTERMLQCVRDNVDNPACDLLWGGPGTMVVAREMLRRHADQRFAEAWQRSAEWLLDEWRDDLWTQVFSGKPAQYVGPGHGLASNVRVLLDGRELLGDERTDQVERRGVDVVKRLALRDGDLVQWPPLIRPDWPVRTQWCHGAPGMVITFWDVAPQDDELTALLVGGGELTWQAGPLVKGPGICHGTGGNAYAFLALFRRTGDERWLERARRFAMHAISQVERQSEGRYSLFTGDVGVALAVAACLDADTRVPGVDLL
jgi:hypothetical protein